MWTALYHGYISFAVTLFAVVGALSVCVIACIILAMLANMLQESVIAFKDNYEDYKFFKYHEANYKVWLSSNGYEMKWDNEANRMKWVRKNDEK